MRQMTMKKTIFGSGRLLAPIALAMWFAVAAHAAAPGVSTGIGATTASFQLVAAEASLNQPDGQAVYSWGYGCKTGFSPTFLPSPIAPPAGGLPPMPVPRTMSMATDGM